jgi:hypothetical protein
MSKPSDNSRRRFSWSWTLGRWPYSRARFLPGSVGPLLENLPTARDHAWDITLITAIVSALSHSSAMIMNAAHQDSYM